MRLCSKTALVVEDDPSFRVAAEFMLRRLGFKSVVAVGDGESAWTELGLARFDLVLCDWNMEPLEGVDLLRRVRADPATSQLRFVLMSANLSEDYWLEAIKAGATDFLIKPFSSQQLRDTVAVALNTDVAAASNVVDLLARARMAGGG